jgi:hypothetical protein
VEPKVAKSRTARELPKFITPKIENLEPKRAKDLRERVDPSEV